jgi:hyperosmotically inducible protein
MPERPSRRVILLIALFAPLLLSGCISTALDVALDVVGGITSAALTAAEGRPLYDTMQDYSIKSEITGKYFDEAMVTIINTDVYEGQVLLTGLVTKAEVKRKAEEIAQRVKGVRKIFNEIQVNSEGGAVASVKDSYIETKLKFNLLAAKGVSSLNYRWRSVNGVVYFIGLAHDQGELNKVIKMTKEMDGVRTVVTHVRLSLKKAPQQ